MSEPVLVHPKPYTFESSAAYFKGDIVFVRLSSTNVTSVGIVKYVMGDWVFVRIRKNGRLTGVIPYLPASLSVIGRIYE